MDTAFLPALQGYCEIMDMKRLCKLSTATQMLLVHIKYLTQRTIWSISTGSIILYIRQGYNLGIELKGLRQRQEMEEKEEGRSCNCL